MASDTRRAAEALWDDWDMRDREVMITACARALDAARTAGIEECVRIVNDMSRDAAQSNDPERQKRRYAFNEVWHRLTALLDAPVADAGAGEANKETSDV